MNFDMGISISPLQENHQVQPSDFTEQKKTLVSGKMLVLLLSDMVIPILEISLGLVIAQHISYK